MRSERADLRGQTRDRRQAHQTAKIHGGNGDSEARQARGQRPRLRHDHRELEAITVEVTRQELQITLAPADVSRPRDVNDANATHRALTSELDRTELSRAPASRRQLW